MHLATRTLVLLLLASLVACSTSPTGRRQLTLFPEAEIAAMGAASFDQIKAKEEVLPPGKVTRQVQCVAAPMLAAVGGDWEIVVFQSEQINAFALPGNKIGVYTGLLDTAENQHQLATVVGHEIAHVTADHANARVSTQFASQAGLELIGAVAGSSESPMGQQLMAALGVGTQVGILLPFSRGQESEADVLGLELMADAGFDPRESVPLWRNMAAAASGQAPPEFISTHPATDTRIGQLEEQMPRAVARYEQARQAGKRPDCDL